MYESSFCSAQGMEHDPKIETSMDRTIEDILRKLVGGYAREDSSQEWQRYYRQLKLMAISSDKAH